MEADPASDALLVALSVSRDELMDFFMSEMKKPLPASPAPSPAAGTKRSAPADAGVVVRDPKRPRDSDGRPVLVGKHPCHKWLRGVAPCKGKICGLDKRQAKPHAFAEADKGDAAIAFTAWVKSKFS
jgi:hypothetical protein